MMITPVHRALLAVDIAGFGSRDDRGQLEVRRWLFQVLTEALSVAGIEDRHCDPLVDRGDGLLILIHPAAESQLLNPFIPELAQTLADHNNSLTPRERGTGLTLRLRVALHSGDVHFDTHGFYGEAISVAFRLLNAPGFKKSLAETTEPLALVVSETTYSTITSNSHAGASPLAFTRKVKASAAKGKRRTGWVHIPHVEQLTAPGRASTHLFQQIEDHVSATQPPLNLSEGLSRLTQWAQEQDHRADEQSLADTPSRAETPIPPTLTTDDIRLLVEVATGDTTDTVARNLGVSNRVVRTRLRAICDRLDVGSPVEAVIYAARHGLLDNTAPPSSLESAQRWKFRTDLLPTTRTG